MNLVSMFTRRDGVKNETASFPRICLEGRGSSVQLHQQITGELGLGDRSARHIDHLWRGWRSNIGYRAVIKTAQWL